MKSYPFSRRCFFEHLEDRCLLASVNLAQGVLTLQGNSGQTNSFLIYPDASGNIFGVADNTGTRFSAAAIKSISILGSTGADTVQIDARIKIPALINTSDGNDFISAGAGNDTIYAGAGNDTIFGGDGNDYIDPGPGTNVVNGGAGINTIVPQVDAQIPVPVITAMSTSIVAGQAINVQAMNSTLKAGTVLTAKFEWNFGDPSGKYNLMQGFNAAHVYDVPGNYTLSLKLTNELGKSSIVTRQITVAADTRPAIYVSSSAGSDSNSGADADHPVQTAMRAAQLAGSNARILFNRGDVFAITQGMAIDGSNVTLDAYGAGAQPVLRYVGTSSGGAFLVGMNSSSQNIVVQNLTFDSATTDCLADAITPRGSGITIRNNTFLNLYDAVNANGNPAGLMIQDNTAPLDTGLAGYFVWLQGTDSTIVGNTVANSTRQHVIRAAMNYMRTNISNNTFTNLDRRPLGDSQDFSKSDINLQWGSFAYVRDNILNDGTLRVGPLGGADGMAVDPTGYQSERTTWVVLEGNTLNNTFMDVAYGLENAVARNNVINNDAGEGFDIAGYDPTYNQQVVNFTIINNTDTNDADTGNFIKLWGQAAGLVLDNNFYLAPNLNAGSFDTAAVWVHQSDLSSFKEIHNNVWSMPASYTWWSNGGVNYVFNGNDRSGYQTPAQWNALPQVSGDLFMNVTPSNGYQFASAGILYGADMTGF